MRTYGQGFASDGRCDLFLDHVQHDLKKLTKDCPGKPAYRPGGGTHNQISPGRRPQASYKHEQLTVSIYLSLLCWGAGELGGVCVCVFVCARPSARLPHVAYPFKESNFGFLTKWPSNSLPVTVSVLIGFKLANRSCLCVLRLRLGGCVCAFIRRGAFPSHGGVSIFMIKVQAFQRVSNSRGKLEQMFNHKLM